MPRPIVSVLIAGLLVGLCGCPGGGQVTDEPPPPPDFDALAPDDAPGDATILRIAWVAPDGDLVLLDPDSGVTSVASGGIAWMDHEPAWSASGSAVAFIAEGEGLIVADLDTGTRRALGQVDADFPRAIAISPDGANVAWVRDGLLRIWREGATLTVEGPERCTTPSWSPDSTRVAVGSMGDDESVDGGLWLVDEDLGARLLVPPVEDEWGATQSIAWSPDGEWLAWARGAGDGWSGDLARSDGSDLRRDAIGAGPLAWFPDSSAILMSVQIEAGAFAAGIYRHADGSTQMIGPDAWDSMAVLSPDGRHVLAWGYDGRALLHDVAAGDASSWADRVTTRWAAWSPDGRIAAIVDDARGGMNVLVGDPGGAGETVARVETEAPWTLRWIELPADAACCVEP
ncbi:MAG: hypothetical protein ACOX9R_15045 [Armatimonadota bacterium]|jgi:Tol biopolymer transport system component